MTRETVYLDDAYYGMGKVCSLKDARFSATASRILALKVFFLLFFDYGQLKS